MKKLLITTLTMLMILGLLTACGNTPVEEMPQNTEDTAVPTAEPSVLHLTAEEDEPANGFLWAHNYSEITITGYVGASNDIVIPETINGKPVTTIREHAFSGFTAMKTLIVPGSVKTMDYAFRNCTSLTSVTLGEGIESMNSAFQECTALTEITLPDSVIEMSYCFEGCTSLAQVHIPEGVTDLYGAFWSCTSLKKLVIPESAGSSFYDIGSFCSGCVSLETLVLPNSYKGNVSTEFLMNIKYLIWGDAEYERDENGKYVQIN